MIRRFRADFIKSDEGTGLAIVEYGSHWDAETLAIHSIYDANNLSNKDASMIIFQRIYRDLTDGEQALLQMSRFSYRKGYDKPYRDRLKIQNVETIRGRMYQARLLAEDAIKRKTSISEVFDEPFRFSVVKQEKEERTIDN